MKLRLPNKLVAAIMAAASPVLFSTLSTATMGAAAVAAVAGQQVMADTVWDANWGIGDMPTIDSEHVLTDITGSANNWAQAHFLRSENEALLVAGYGLVAQLNGTASGAVPGVFGGSKTATSTDASWLLVSAGTYDVIGGSVWNAWGVGATSRNFSADSHIMVNMTSGSVKNVIGGIHQDLAQSTFTGHTYISVKTNSVTGNIIGGSTGAHSQGATLIGNTHIYIYTALTGNSGALIAGDSSSLIIGGSTLYTNVGTTIKVDGDTNITLDLSGVTSAADFGKTLVGANVMNVTTGTGDGQSILTGSANISISHAENVTFKKRTMGGGLLFTGAATKENLAATNVTIGSGKFEGDVMGGSWQNSNNTSTIGATNLTLNGGTFTGRVYGGNYMAAANATSDITDSYVTINGGSFSANVMGGSFQAAANTSTIGTTHLTLKNGTFTDRVYGGNLLTSNGTSTITTTDVNISGGTFSQNVIAGSYTNNSNATMKADQTKLTISGGTFDADVFAGHFVHTSGTTALINDKTITNISAGTFGAKVSGGTYFNTSSATNVSVHAAEMNLSGGTFNGFVMGGLTIDGSGTAALGTMSMGDVTMNITGGTFNADILGGSDLYRNNAGQTLAQGNISISLGGTATIKNNVYAGGYQRNASKLTAASTKVSIGSGVTFEKDGGLTISALYKHGSANTSTVTGSKTLAFTDGATYTNLSGVTFDGFDTVEVTKENGSVTLPSLSNTTKLTKNGAGALTITSVSNLSGGLVVNGGRLTLSGGSEQAMSGDVTVNSGAELALGRNDFFQYNGHTLTVDGGTVAFGGTRQSFNSGYSVIVKNGAKMVGVGGNYNGEYVAALDYYSSATSTLKSTTGNNVIESNIAARDSRGTVVLAVDDENSATTSSLTLKGSMVGSGTFKKTGADKLILDGGDGGVTHNTRFIMSSGELQVDNAVTFSNTVTLAADTSLTINGTLTTNTLSLAETLTLGGSGMLTLGNGGLTVGAASGNFTAVGDLHYSDGANGFLTGGGTVTLISHGNTTITGLGDSATVTFTDGIQANLSKTDAGDIVASWEGSAQDDSPYYVNTAVALNDVDDTATVIALNGGTLTVDRELKETESLLLANQGSVLNIAEGIDVSAGKVTITDQSSSLHLTGQGYVVIDAGEAASHATEILGTATGTGNMKIAADATLAKNTPTHLTGTLQIGTGDESQITLTLGSGWGANGQHDSESFDLSSFSSIVLDNGRIAYNGAASTLKALTVTENGGKLSMWDSNVSGTTQLANDTTLNGDLTLEVGWKAKMNIAHLTGAGDLTVNTGLAGATADDVTTLSIASLQGYTGKLSISKNNGTLEPVAITTGGAVNMKGMSLTNATVNMVTTGNVTMNSELALNNSSLLIRSDGDVRTHTFNSLAVSGTGVINIEESGTSGEGWNAVINVTSLTNGGDSAATLKLGNAARAYTSLYNINGGSFNGEIILNGTATTNTRRTGLQINAAGVTDNSVITFDSSSAGNNNLGLGINADISVKGIQHAANSSVASTIYSGAITNNKSGDNFDSQGTTVHTLTITGDGTYSTSATLKSKLNLTMAGSGTQTFSGDMSAFNGSLTVTDGALKFTNAGTFDFSAINVKNGELYMAQVAAGKIVAATVGDGATIEIGSVNSNSGSHWSDSNLIQLTKETGATDMSTVKVIAGGTIAYNTNQHNGAGDSTNLNGAALVLKDATKLYLRNTSTDSTHQAGGEISTGASAVKLQGTTELFVYGYITGAQTTITDDFITVEDEDSTAPSKLKIVGDNDNVKFNMSGNINLNELQVSKGSVVMNGNSVTVGTLKTESESNKKAQVELSGSATVEVGNVVQIQRKAGQNNAVLDGITATAAGISKTEGASSAAISHAGVTVGSAPSDLAALAEAVTYTIADVALVDTNIVSYEQLAVSNVSLDAASSISAVAGSTLVGENRLTLSDTTPAVGQGSNLTSDQLSGLTMGSWSTLEITLNDASTVSGLTNSEGFTITLSNFKWQDFLGVDGSYIGDDAAAEVSYNRLNHDFIIMANINGVETRLDVLNAWQGGENNADLVLNVVPEPTTSALSLLALAGLAARRRRH